MATRMQQRRGTAAQWSGANPILAAGEIGFESDTSKFKIGDGVNHWTDLVYYASAAEVASLIDGAPDLLNTLNELAAAVGDDPTFFTTVASNLSAHSSDTTSVHGIANTALLATQQNVDDKIATATSAIEGYADGLISTEVTNRNSAISTHSSDTTSVHGIADTSALALTEDLTAHESATESVHGIANTAELATLTDLSNAIATAATDMSANAGVGIDWNTVSQAFDIDSTVATKTYANDAVGTHNTETTNVHGITDTSKLVLTTDTGTVTSTMIANGTIVNADINSSAAIDWTKIAPSSTVSATELGYLDGVTSAIQTQLDAKLASSTASSTYAPKADPTFTGTVAAANVTISGDLTVSGTTTTVNATNLAISDPLLYIATGNAANANDLGIVGHATVSGTYQHMGLARDHADGKWKLFSGITTEPTNTLTFSEATYDTLKLGGVEFSDGTQSKVGVPSITPIISKTASYTLSALTERDSVIEVSSSSATTITIPTNSAVAFPIGTSIDISQISTGQVTIAGAAGVTVNSTPGLKLRTQWSNATLFKRGTDSWIVYGDLTA